MSVADDRVERLARALLAVRDGAPLLDPPPPELAPADVDAAYAVADRVVAALEARHGRVSGYKVGATSVGGQRLLGLVEPFYGRCPAGLVLDDESTVVTGGRACTIEAEVAFVLGRDLDARARPYDEVEVAAAVARAVPAFELNRPAYAKPFEIGGRWLIADNGVTQGIVIGGPGRGLDAPGPPLAMETLRMWRNAEPCADGRADVVLGDPIRALTWLANALPRRGRGLRAGDVVVSGATTPPIPVFRGDAVVAEFATLGVVRVRIA